MKFVRQTFATPLDIKSKYKRLFSNLKNGNKYVDYIFKNPWLRTIYGKI